MWTKRLIISQLQVEAVSYEGNVEIDFDKGDTGTFVHIKTLESGNGYQNYVAGGTFRLRPTLPDVGAGYFLIGWKEGIARVVFAIDDRSLVWDFTKHKEEFVLSNKTDVSLIFKGLNANEDTLDKPIPDTSTFEPIGPGTERHIESKDGYLLYFNLSSDPLENRLIKLSILKSESLMDIRMNNYGSITIAVLR
jgi:hypothetical protein